ncbi:MAG: hypothetical protein OEW09_03040 [Anaerolineae bacterium]|nr:hypothetical protein [Anaerolineae bacterium]
MSAWRGDGGAGGGAGGVAMAPPAITGAAFSARMKRLLHLQSLIFFTSNTTGLIPSVQHRMIELLSFDQPKVPSLPRN